MVAVTIAEQRDNYLLLARGSRFVVVEQRNDKIYNLHDGKRNGIDRNLMGLSEIVDEKDWVGELAARAALDEAITGWTRLSECMR